MKIALQKSGRLHIESIKLLQDCGINFPLDLNKDKDKLKISSFNFDILFLRDDDIPNYVQNGIADIGVVGKNVVFEEEKKFLIREYLGFGYCRLSFAVPKSKRSLYKSLNDLTGKRIATSHPNLLDKFLKEQKIYSYIHAISGSVEITPNIGVSDAIFDLVSSGSTLNSNNLKEIETIFSSEAVLICHTKYNQTAKKLISRLQEIKRARDNKYLLFNAPNKKLDKIISFLSKKCKKLHILPIEKSGWTYIQGILPNFILWYFLDELKRNSVKDFVVMERRLLSKNNNR